jgi:glyoxylase-like metal-dependent hydrolase (beta-lactamase superfamily II)
MNVHLLNCATIRLYLPSIEVATCCLLVEGSEGLILVDTGVGTRDHFEPAWGMRIVKRFTHMFGSPEETAVNQVIRLGYSPAEVRHIVVTHLHLDHAGGLPDFPNATVHVFKTELETAISAGVLRGFFYISDHWAHGPNWRVHYGMTAVDWFGFRSMPVLDDPSVKVLLVLLPGHTRGHCGVAVGDGSNWVLHCGDTIAMDALEKEPGSVPARLLGPHFPQLHKLAQRHGQVQLIPAHLRANKVPSLGIAG